MKKSLITLAAVGACHMNFDPIPPTEEQQANLDEYRTTIPENFVPAFQEWLKNSGISMYGQDTDTLLETSGMLYERHYDDGTIYFVDEDGGWPQDKSGNYRSPLFSCKNYDGSKGQVFFGSIEEPAVSLVIHEMGHGTNQVHSCIPSGHNSEVIWASGFDNSIEKSLKHTDFAYFSEAIAKMQNMANNDYYNWEYERNFKVNEYHDDGTATYGVIVPELLIEMYEKATALDEETWTQGALPYYADWLSDGFSKTDIEISSADIEDGLHYLFPVAKAQIIESLEAVAEENGIQL